MADKKNYWMDKEIFSGVPGSEVHKALSECFADYYSSDKRHAVEINLNGVVVTMKRNP